MPVFKTGAINHSATSPELLQFYYSLPLSHPHRPANFVLIQLVTLDGQNQYRGFQDRLFQPLTHPSAAGVTSVSLSFG
jgi:hypothetical protein